MPLCFSVCILVCYVGVKPESVICESEHVNCFSCFTRVNRALWSGFLLLAGGESQTVQTVAHSRTTLHILLETLTSFPEHLLSCEGLSVQLAAIKCTHVSKNVVELIH